MGRLRTGGIRFARGEVAALFELSPVSIVHLSCRMKPGNSSGGDEPSHRGLFGQSSSRAPSTAVCKV